MNANNRQEGGTHYQTPYQHWDFALDTGLGYLVGCATKYVARWRKKGGSDDLCKAAHYVDKLIDEYVPVVDPAAEGGIMERIGFCKTFAELNNLSPREQDIITNLVAEYDFASLEAAALAIDKLINDYDSADPGRGYVDQD